MGGKSDYKNLSDEENLIDDFINLKSKGLNNKKIINNLKIPESKIKKWCDRKNWKNEKYREFYKYYTRTIYEIRVINKEKQMKEVLAAISSGENREEAARIAKIPLYKIGQWSEEGKLNLDKNSVTFYQNLKKIEDEFIDEGIFKPFPKEYEHMFKSSKTNKSGIAWVNMPGKKWEYNRNIDGKPIRLVSETLEELYLEVVKNDLLWGIRDYEKARKVLDIPKEILLKHDIDVGEEPRKIVADEGIFKPLSKELSNHFTTVNSSGIAWVSRQGSSWVYSKQQNKNIIRLLDDDLHGLYRQVVDADLPWGIRDYDKAKNYLDIPEEVILKYSKYSEPEIDDVNRNVEGIYAPLNKKYENVFKSSKTNKTGIAWVNLIGKRFVYSKKGSSNVKLADEDIYGLYRQVVDADLPWGIRDYDRAKDYLDIPEEVILKYSKYSEPEIDDEKDIVVDEGIYKPLPKKCEYLFRSSKMNKTGIAWVNMPGNKWEYTRNVNGEFIRIVCETLEELYVKVVEKGFLWGIRDYDRAKDYLDIPEDILSKYSKDLESEIEKEDLNIVVDEGIYKQFPEEYEYLFRSSKMNKSGIAWVNRAGKKWTYIRNIDEKYVKFASETLEGLYLQVIRNNLLWGIRDYDRAKDYLDIPEDILSKYSKKLELGADQHLSLNSTQNLKYDLNVNLLKSDNLFNVVVTGLVNSDDVLSVLNIFKEYGKYIKRINTTSIDNSVDIFIELNIDKLSISNFERFILKLGLNFNKLS
ncbi:hypothetical protein [Methanobrevibacter sp.]|uniref:hypothetical protein n=1 Tax=Methanobrevibacter sp. TaxID=66852 RepID=UPI0038696027